MTDMLETGVTWLNQQRNAHMVKSVTYRRGQSSVSVSATNGRTQTKTIGDDAVEVSGQVDDWIINAADLVLDGRQVCPESGDQIRETVGSQTFVYEVRKLGNVSGIGDGETWRFSDAFKQSIRIHTVRTAIN
jgi:hypothetical protein